MSNSRDFPTLFVGRIEPEYIFVTFLHHLPCREPMHFIDVLFFGFTDLQNLGEVVQESPGTRVARFRK